MSKITFRADDDLITQLEEFDASKSEVMREALREYLGEPSDPIGLSEPATDTDSIDDLVAERVDEIIEERLGDTRAPARAQDVNVNITLEGESVTARGAADDSRESSATPSQASGGRKTDGARSENADERRRKTCAQCGENLTGDHVYCPNCGEKASHRVFCECGDELRTDWAFCPGCGRRTPAADVLADRENDVNGT